MQPSSPVKRAVRTPLSRRLQLGWRQEWPLYALLLPALAFIIVFCYFPMYGVQIAFRDYKAVFGITGSKWVGLKHFETFFKSYYCGRLFANTFLLNFYGLLFGFPIPVVMAIFLNQLRNKRARGFTQTVIYVPHFISTVVLAGMIYLFFSPTTGLVNKLITATGGQSIYFMIEAGWFRPLFIGSEIWQNAGWNTILYIAALNSINPSLYEASTIDGAPRWQKIKHIDIPPGAHRHHDADPELRKPLEQQHRQGAAHADLRQHRHQRHHRRVRVQRGPGQGAVFYTTAIGLCLNVINFAIIMIVNAICRRLGETSLF